MVDDRPDVIVVLGAALLPGGRASLPLRRRVRHAARLFHLGRAPYLLVTGGTVGGLPSEARVMRDLALEYGVPEERVVVEDQAANTFENAAYCGDVMALRGWRRALVVTDAFHLPRALFLFRLLGIPASGDGVRDRLGEPAWRWYGAYLREAAAFLKSLLLGLAGRHKHVARAASHR